MANHKSAIKRTVRNANRATINGARRNRVRTFIKRVEQAINDNNPKEAETHLKAAQPEMDRAVSKGIFPKSMVSRKLSRLSQKIKALKA